MYYNKYMSLEIIFIVVWLVVFCYVFYSLFTRKGRNFQIKIRWNAEVVKDYGIINTDKMVFSGLTNTQNLRLLKCKSKTGTFHVLEVSNSGIFSLQLFWIKLSNQTLKKIISVKE